MKMTLAHKYTANRNWEAEGWYPRYIDSVYTWRGQDMLCGYWVARQLGLSDRNERPAKVVLTVSAEPRKDWSRTGLLVNQNGYFKIRRYNPVIAEYQVLHHPLEEKLLKHFPHLVEGNYFLYYALRPL